LPKLAALQRAKFNRHRDARTTATAAGATRESAAATESTGAAALGAASSAAARTRCATAAGSAGLRSRRRGGITLAREDAEICCGATGDSHHDCDHDKFTHKPFRLCLRY
jgi:hypothetical protein